MPTAQLLGILIAIIVIWIVLKVMKVALKLIVLVIGFLVVAGLLYFLFAR
jgi:hypothetical protein